MQSFITCCAEVEDLAALVYRELEAQTADNAALQEMLRTLATDEEDHARQLRFALRVSPRETFTGVNEQASDPFILKGRISKLLEQVKAKTLSEYEVLKLAVELENDFRSIHAGYALMFKDDSMKKLFNALARDDQKHVQGLSDYLQNYKKRQ